MKTLATMFAAVAALSIPSFADAANLGVRVGATMDPEQIHFGGHADVTPWDDTQLRLQPGVDVGLGDDLVVVALNLDSTYRFRERWDSWSPFVGGSVGVFVVDRDNEALSGDSSTEVGPSILAGLERGIDDGRRFFVESRVGLSNAPDFKVSFGWTFAQ